VAIIIIKVMVAARHKQVYVPDVRDITIRRTVIMILQMLHKRPKGWVVGGIKKEFGTVSIDACAHKPDFSIIAIE
jgi:hypothetical protein